MRLRSHEKTLSSSEETKRILEWKDKYNAENHRELQSSRFKKFKGPFTLSLVIAIPKSGFLAIAVLAKEMGYLPVP